MSKDMLSIFLLTLPAAKLNRNLVVPD